MHFARGRAGLVKCVGCMEKTRQDGVRANGKLQRFDIGVLFIYGG